MRSHDHCGVQVLPYSTVFCNFLNKNIWGSGENHSSCISSIQSTLKQMKQLGSSVVLEVLALLRCHAALVGSYWRFGTVYRFHLQGSRSLLRLPATTYQPILHNIPEERRPQQRRGGSLISRSVLPSRTIGLSRIGEKASAIRSIDLKVCHPHCVRSIIQRCSVYIHTVMNTTILQLVAIYSVQLHVSGLYEGHHQVVQRTY